MHTSRSVLRRAALASTRVNAQAGLRTATRTALGRASLALAPSPASASVSALSRVLTPGAARSIATYTYIDGAAPPELPSPPTKPSYPCPLLTAQEMETYLAPLYARGWNIDRSLRLQKRVAFDSDADVAAYFEAVWGLVGKEKHHPDINAPAGRAVYVALKTHDAYRPAQEGEDGEKKEKEPMSGVTLRDVRFALQLEELWARDFKALGRGQVAHGGGGSRPLEPSGLEQNSTSGSHGKGRGGARRRRGGERENGVRCIICKERHPAHTCPKKDEIKPTKPCPNCGGSHWAVACPTRARKPEWNDSPQASH